MPIKFSEVVKETTTTTGTGSFTLSGNAITGYDRFQDALSDGDRLVYEWNNLNYGGSQREIGLGTWNSAGNTLDRDQVYWSTTGSKLTAASGLKDVSITAAGPQFEARPVSVKAFGATGDGSTDDTTAIQNAIDAAELLSQKESLYFPNGVYRITSKLTITEELHLQGEGRNAIIKNEGTDIALQVGSVGAGPAHFVIKDLSIIGSGGEYGGSSHLGYHGLVLDNARYTVIDNVEIRNHKGHGVLLRNNAWINRFVNCKIDDNAGDGINSLGDATYANGNGLVAIGCTFTDNYYNGIKWQANNLTLIQNYFATNILAGVYIASDANKAAKCVSITGNYFEENVDAQIYLEVGAGNRMECLIIEANDLDGDSAGSTSTALIEAVGTAEKLRNIRIGPNGYSGVSGNITHAVDLGDCPDNQCLIHVGYQGDDDPTDKFTNLGKGKISNPQLISEQVVNAVSANNATIDWRRGPAQTLNLSLATDNLGTVTFSNDPSFPCIVALKVVGDDATRTVGSWPVTGGGSVYWGDLGEPTWEASHTVNVLFHFDGASYWQVANNPKG